MTQEELLENWYDIKDLEQEQEDLNNKEPNEES
jgi:hypothetical protein